MIFPPWLVEEGRIDIAENDGDDGDIEHRESCVVFGNNKDDEDDEDDVEKEENVGSKGRRRDISELSELSEFSIFFWSRVQPVYGVYVSAGKGIIVAGCSPFLYNDNDNEDDDEDNDDGNKDVNEYEILSLNLSIAISICVCISIIVILLGLIIAVLGIVSIISLGQWMERVEIEKSE